MRFGVLGVLEVHTDHGEPVRVPELKVRALLAALLAAEGEVVSADRLTEDLWETRRPADPRAALQTRVSQLRRALEDAEPGARGLVVSEGPGYALRAPRGAVDAERVADLLAASRDTTDPARRAAVLDDALALWRGPAFADTADAAFARPAAARLDALRLAVQEERAEAHLDAGPPPDLAGELEALVAEHPLRERLRAAHLRALYAAGRPQEALATYRDLRTRLREELGTDPGPELVALERSVLTHDLADTPDAADAAPPPTLPAALTELVGRRDDLARVDAALDADRLVTLVGHGGVGKTRLALAAAHAREGRHGGARFVELDRLAPGADAAAVATAVAAACGLRSATTSGAREQTGPEGLGAALRERALLLVLDNAEHVLSAAGTVVRDLLAHAPGVHLLVTSREPVEVPGEALVAVGPLDTGDADAGAVALFLDRVRAADPDADADPADVLAICRRLDGIPLALELAAARVRAFGVPGLLERLDDRFAVLARSPRAAGPERQRTLRAALDWSWELLTADEAAAMCRLAPCLGGFTLATAEELAGPDAADLVARLVDRSWLVAVGRGSCRRYRMLESTAAYAAERLAATGEDRAARDRHLALHLALLARADPQLRGREQRAWLEALDAESANLDAALDHAAATVDAGSALTLVERAAWYRFLRGRVDVAVRACDVALAVPGADRHTAAQSTVRAWRDALAVWANTAAPLDASPRPGTPARVRWFDVFARWGVRPPEEAISRLAEVLAEFRASGDSWGTAAALSTRASIRMVTDDAAGARPDAECAGALFAELGDRWGDLQVTSTLGAVALIEGDHEEARTRTGAALRTAEDLGLGAESAGLLASLGRVALADGDFATASEQLARARDRARALGNSELVDYADFGLALAARRRGDLDVAEEMVVAWLARRPRDDAFRAVPFSELGFVAELRGDADTALSRHRDAHRDAVRWDSPRSVALALEGMAGVRVLAGAPADAARLLGAAGAMRARAGAPLGPGERGDVDRIRARVRDALGTAAADAAEAEGAADPPDPV